MPKTSQSFSAKLDFYGKTITIETGKLAGLASGSVTVRCDDTVVLVTAVVSENVREDIDYFPLTVDFEERWYASGKISGSRFIKREARPSELAILRARLIDRPIRPLFPKGSRNTVQVIATCLSVDLENDPALLGLLGASTALMITGAPFSGPIAGVKVGLVGDKLVVNPTPEELKESKLDLLVAGTEEAITMVESQAKEISEEQMLKALDFAHQKIKELVKFQKEFLAQLPIEKQEFKLFLPSTEAYEAVDKYLVGKLGAAIRHEDKFERRDAVATLEDEVMEEFAESFEEAEIAAAFDKVIEGEVRRSILEEESRPDHRKLDEIRPITCEIDLLPRTHGSAVFTRGQTQVLGVVTLGSPSKAQLVETMDQDYSRYFMLHYNFPPYSTGEAKPMRGTSRREVGHGILAEKALQVMMPPHEEFPYTVRVVADVLACNGSSSMASVCAGSLSLMAAGVPIKEQVAGIAMGLVSKNGDLSQGYKILSDITGTEDFAGDMDFKVAGTQNGICALQLDIKAKGLTLKLFEEALAQARSGRLSILEKMNAAIQKPKSELSQYAPRLTTIKIDPSKIREVIGKGGETINKIIAETGAEIDIEDDGTIVIASVDQNGAKEAVAWIERITKEPEVGETYLGTVVKIMDFGAFVEFLPGKEGLVHISQLADKRVEKVEDEVKTGEKIMVKLLEKDDMGRYNLSRKAVDGRN